MFDACCTNDHARVPIPTYQGDPSQLNLEDDFVYEGEDAQFTPFLTRAKGANKRAYPYSPTPKMNEEDGK